MTELLKDVTSGVESSPSSQRVVPRCLLASGLFCRFFDFDAPGTLPWQMGCANGRSE